MWNTKIHWERILNKQLHIKAGLWGWVRDEKASGQDHLISSLIRESVTTYSVK